MANLLHTKLQELERLAESITTQLQQASTQIQQTAQDFIAREIAQATETLQEAHAQAHTQLESSTNTRLETTAQTLETSIQRELASVKKSLQTDFTDKLQKSLESIAQNFSKTAIKTLASTLTEPITQAIATSQETQSLLESSAQKTAENYMNAQDLSELIDYDRLNIPRIAENLAKKQNLKTLANKTYREQISNHLENLDQSSTLIKTLEKHAKGIYSRAMASDELIKDRYESKLRLLSLKIFGTQELVELILQESARRYALAQKPATIPDPIKNNILVVG